MPRASVRHVMLYAAKTRSDDTNRASNLAQCATAGVTNRREALLHELIHFSIGLRFGIVELTGDQGSAC